MRKSALIVFVMFAVVTLFACKQKPGNDESHSKFEMNPEKFVERIGEGLDLSDEQKEALTTYFAEKFKNAPKMNFKKAQKPRNEANSDSTQSSKSCNKKACEDSTKCSKACSEKPKVNRDSMRSERMQDKRSNRGNRQFFSEEDMAEFKKILTADQYSKMEERMNNHSFGRPGEGAPRKGPRN